MQMIEQALSEISKGSSEIIDQEYIVKLLTNYYENNETYLVKAGFDPTATDLHLGHTVLLQKLATFQEYGGHVQFLIGDFTAMIGDPTGKSETRKVLTKEQVLQNAKSYEEQVFKVLDREKTTILFNSHWFEKLGSSGMVQLATQSTVARMLERDDFDKRYKEGSPVAISEFLYPLLQGYDSVEMNSDIEIGGTDQKFNLLMGRQMQKSYGLKKQQAVLMMPILEGLDGVQKMSKSLNNFISIKEDANEMFAKVMSISDELMWVYYDLLSSKTTQTIAQMKEEVASDSLHPKKVKEELGLEIVTRYHNASLATVAQEEFNNVFAKNDIPSDIKTVSFAEETWVVKAIGAGISMSSSDIRRIISQGGLKIDNKKIEDINFSLTKGDYIIKLGKKNFLKVEIN